LVAFFGKSGMSKAQVGDDGIYNSVALPSEHVALRLNRNIDNTGTKAILLVSLERVSLG
jgi:hypothetical protein